MRGKVWHFAALTAGLVEPWAKWLATAPFQGKYDPTHPADT